MCVQVNWNGIWDGEPAAGCHGESRENCNRYPTRKKKQSDGRALLPLRMRLSPCGMWSRQPDDAARRQHSASTSRTTRPGRLGAIRDPPPRGGSRGTQKIGLFFSGRKIGPEAIESNDGT